MDERLRTVGEVAGLAGVTVRTLHHYDELGLLTPSRRNAAGYRLYDRADLERLQEILFLRAMDLPLDEVRRIVDAPGYVRADALRAQLARIDEATVRLRQVAKAIEAALTAHEEGSTMSDEAMFAVFDGLDPDQHEARRVEAEERWGDTDAWTTSQRRTKRYGSAEWQAIKDEAEQLETAFAALLADGADATGGAAMDVAEQHRQHVTRWFYDCPPAMHRGLGQMYVADDRFAQHYDERAEGLAAFVSAAVQANADRQEAGS